MCMVSYSRIYQTISHPVARRGFSEIVQGRAGEKEREREIVRGDVGGPRPTYRMGCVDIYVCDI